MALAYVQGKAGMQWSGASYNIGAFGSNVTAGNLIVVFVFGAANGASFTISDSLSNTYSAAGSAVSLASPAGTAQIFYAKNISGGACTVTVTPNASMFSTCIAHEVSGASTTAPLDQYGGQAQTDPGTGTDAVTSGSVTTTTDGEYIFGGTQGIAGTATASGTGYTDRLTQNGAHSEDRIQAGAGSIAATFTNTASAFEDNITLVATFKAPAAGGGGKPTYAYQQQ